MSGIELGVPDDYNHQAAYDKTQPPRKKRAPVLGRRRFLQGVGAGAASTVVSATESPWQRMQLAQAQGVQEATQTARSAISHVRRVNEFLSSLKGGLLDPAFKLEIPILNALIHVRHKRSSRTIQFPPLVTSQKIDKNIATARPGFLPGVSPLDPNNPYSFWILCYTKDPYTDRFTYETEYIGDWDVEIKRTDCLPLAWTSRILGYTSSGGVGIVHEGDYGGPPMPGSIIYPN